MQHHTLHTAHSMYYFADSQMADIILSFFLFFVVVVVLLLFRSRTNVACLCTYVVLRVYAERMFIQVIAAHLLCFVMFVCRELSLPPNVYVLVIDILLLASRNDTVAVVVMRNSSTNNRLHCC